MRSIRTSGSGCADAGRRPLHATARSDPVRRHGSITACECRVWMASRVPRDTSPRRDSRGLVCGTAAPPVPGSFDMGMRRPGPGGRYRGLVLQLLIRRCQHELAIRRGVSWTVLQDDLGCAGSRGGTTKLDTRRPRTGGGVRPGELRRNGPYSRPVRSAAPGRRSRRRSRRGAERARAVSVENSPTDCRHGGLRRYPGSWLGLSGAGATRQ